MARRHLLLLLPLAAAAGLRLFRIGLPALTSDEAFSWRLIGYPVPEMLRRAAADVHPPLYYLALDMWAAVFGTSAAAMRSLSALLGVLSVGAAYAVCLSAARLDRRADGAARGGALLAALLVATQAASVGHGRNARMYALGVLLASVSGWLLLRGLRATERGWGWWIAYGAAAAAAAATHYYLLFTVAAQVAAAVLLPSVRREGAAAAARALLARVAVALAVAAALLAPWLPVLARQAGRVHQEYWIDAPSAAAVATAVVQWAAGAEVAVAHPLPWVAALAAALVLGWSRGGPGTRFLLVQALLPWVLGLGVSVASGRPIFLERYMAFGQLFLLCAWGAIVARLSRPARLAAAAALVMLAASGVRATWSARYPDRPTAFAHAARYLKRNIGPGDLVLARSPRALNKLRHYAEQIGADAVDVRYLPSGPVYDDHFSHRPSLEPAEVMDHDPFRAPAGPRTIWRVEDVLSAPEPAPPGWRLAHARMLEGGDTPVVLVAGYERSADATGE